MQADVRSLSLAARAAALLAAALAPRGCSADLPIAADSLLPLDGAAWTAQSSAGGAAIPAAVPGDIGSDLAAAGVIRSPWLDLTWRDEAARWDLAAWTYSVSFATPAAWAAGDSVQLVLDSVRMAADVSLNGRAVGSATSQHLRYAFEVGASLAPPGGANALTVVFPATVTDTRNDAGRFMGCSGGWDWAPYSNETTGKTPKGIRTFSKGLVRSVYLARTAEAGGAGAALTAVKALVFYAGDYPTAPLSDASAGPWRVDVTAYLLAPAGAQGAVTFTGEWAAAQSPVSVNVSLPAGVETPVTVSLVVPAGGASLWWPNTVGAGGPGSRRLYYVNTSFASSSTGASVSAQRRVAFRSLALVTADDSNPARLAGVPGSGNLTMRFKVNGADIMTRGANWIPLEEIDGRNTDAAHVAAVQSAAAAHMNLMRIWGGGTWPPDVFFDACDAAGVLLFIDVPYASQADSHHFAAATDEQRAEIAYQLRRISPHPSVALIDSCNECGGSAPFSSFVAPAVAAEDPSRPVWPASPSVGWADGVDRLWGLPAPGHAFAIVDAKAPVEPTPGCDCVQQVGAFAYGFPLSPFLAPLKVADAAACCALCESTPTCAASNYESGGCQLIAEPLAPQLRDDASAVVLYPPSSVSAGLVVPVPFFSYSGAEQHGPYQCGGGWPTVNGGGPPASSFDPQQPPHFGAAFSTAYGAGAPGFFTSEFGVGQPASFEIMSPTLSPTYWGMHGGNHSADTCTGGFAHVCTGGNVMAQRNYGCDDALATFFQQRLTFTLDDSGEEAFRAQLYVCQLATALSLKSTTEEHKSRNMYGLMTWQLGEVWPTYGWGSLECEYSGARAADSEPCDLMHHPHPLLRPPHLPPKPLSNRHCRADSSGEGSVTGGRWKPSHYVLAKAYANTHAACDDSGACFVRSDDALAPLAAEAVFSVTRLQDGAVAELSRAPVSLPRGANAVAWLCAGGGGASPPCPKWATLLPAAGCAAAGTDCALTVTVTDAASGAVLASNTQLLAAPGRLNASLAVRVTAVVGAEAPDGSVPVTLTAAGGASTAAPALFVTLFTLANGRFSDNFLTLLSGSAEVAFLPFAPGQRDVLAASLRVNALGELLRPLPPPRPAHGTCTDRADTDGTGAGATAPGNSLNDCCAACWADPQCLASAYNPAAPGTCWLKYESATAPRAGIQYCAIDWPPPSG